MVRNDNAYNGVLDDLDELKRLAERLSEGLKDGCMISDDKYLMTEALNVLTISKLEYFLNSSKLINGQHEIKEIIKNSSVLNQLEKEHLIYLFLIRHTIAHQGGFFDTKFFDNLNRENFKQLKVNIPANGESLTPIGPSLIIMYIELIKKIVIEQYNLLPS